jgi:hypothetical protein
VQPEVVQEAHDGSGWDVDHDGTRGDVDVDDGIDRRVVRREPDRLGADEVVGNAQVVEAMPKTCWSISRTASNGTAG